MISDYKLFITGDDRTGKTTLAKYLAREHDFFYVETSTVIHELLLDEDPMISASPNNDGFTYSHLHFKHGYEGMKELPGVREVMVARGVALHEESPTYFADFLSKEHGPVVASGVRDLRDVERLLANGWVEVRLTRSKGRVTASFYGYAVEVHVISLVNRALSSIEAILGSSSVREIVVASQYSHPPTGGSRVAAMVYGLPATIKSVVLCGSRKYMDIHSETFMLQLQRLRNAPVKFSSEGPTGDHVLEVTALDLFHSILQAQRCFHDEANSTR